MPRVRSSLLAASVLGVVATAPADAAPRVHHFAPTSDVSVSFKLSPARDDGVLVRFARNHVVVTRDRAGRLALRVGAGPARRLVAARGRALPVHVTLSARRARLALGRRATSISGSFVAERAVSVNVPGAVVRNTAASAPARAVAPRPQSAATGASVVAGAPAAAGATGTTPAVTVPAAPSSADPVRGGTGTTTGSKLFSPTSVWNAPLADDAPLDPSSDRLVKTLTDTVAQNITAGWGPWIETGRTSSFYTVPADQPTVRVALDPGSWKVTLQQTFDAVPIPPNAEPAAGPDAHMTIYQPSTNRLWELFKASKQTDGWHASYGGAMSNVSDSPGYYDAASWPGLSNSAWGATATSLPVIAGTMMVDELRAGTIPHALAMNVPYALPKTYSWPAMRTDGTSTDPNAIPEGARFRLDPKLDIDALNLPPMTKVMAKAAQHYGIIVRDQTAHAVAFFAENPNQLSANPYVGTTGFFGGPAPNPVMKAFPWKALQLVKMDLRPAAPAVTTQPASAVTAVGATLGAELTAHNQSTTYRFEYGPTTAYGSTTPTQTLSTPDDAPHAVTVGISGLAPGQTYHFRVVAANATGTTYGSDATFTTPTVAGVGYRATVLAGPGLASYWRLDDRSGTTAADETGANPGIYSGPVTLGQAGALADTTNLSAGFTAGTAELTGSARGLGATGTMEGWFDWRGGVAVMRDNTLSGGWILAFDNGGKLAYRVAGATYDTGRTVASVRAAWHHVAVTKNGGSVAFYLDGQLVHSGTGAGSTAPVMPWHVMRNGTAAQYAQGRADEIAVFTTALSAATIAQQWSAGRAP